MLDELLTGIFTIENLKDPFSQATAVLVLTYVPRWLFPEITDLRLRTVAFVLGVGIRGMATFPYDTEYGFASIGMWAVLAIVNGAIIAFAAMKIAEALKDKLGDLVDALQQMRVKK